MIMPQQLRYLVCIGAFLFVAALQLNAAAAQESQPPIVLGVVDFDFIMNDSKAGKGVKGQYEEKRTSLDKEYEKQLKAFRGKEKDLAEQRKSMSEEDFKKKVDALDAEGKKIEKSLADRRRALDSGLNKAVGQVRKSLLEIVTAIATKQKMTLVLNKANIILAAEGFDFTDEALKQINAKLPSVKLQASN